MRTKMLLEMNNMPKANRKAEWQTTRPKQETHKEMNIMSSITEKQHIRTQKQINDMQELAGSLGLALALPQDYTDADLVTAALEIGRRRARASPRTIDTHTMICLRCGAYDDMRSCSVNRAACTECKAQGYNCKLQRYQHNREMMNHG